MMLSFRAELPGDEGQLRRLHDEAFGGSAESAIVDELRASGEPLVSLVAEDNSEIVGHVLFSPVTLGTLRGMGLGPMAVTPTRQRSGIGSRLVELGLSRLRESSCPFVVVLGHPEYYPRFGFSAAGKRGVGCQWDVPADVFMILVLDEAAMKGVAGTARYLPIFGGSV